MTLNSKYTSSSFPQNHAAPGGAPSIAGSSDLLGRLLEFGSNWVVMMDYIAIILELSP